MNLKKPIGNLRDREGVSTFDKAKGPPKQLITVISRPKYAGMVYLFYFESNPRVATRSAFVLLESQSDPQFYRLVAMFL